MTNKPQKIMRYLLGFTLGLWVHPLSIRVKDKTPLFVRNSVRAQHLGVGTQPLVVGTQPSSLWMEFLSNKSMGN